MSRGVIACLLVAASGVEPTGAAITTNTFGATVVVRPGGRTARVTPLMGCEPEGVFDIDVTVTKVDTIAAGSRHGRCTGAKETYDVTGHCKEWRAARGGSRRDPRRGVHP